MEDLKKEIAELSAKVKALETENSELKEQLSKLESDSKTTIEELTKQLKAEASKVSGNKVVVKHDKRSFEVVIPKFRHEGEEISAEELAKKPQIVKELVESGSSVLKEVEK